MRKIPTLFVRDLKTHQLLDEIHPDAAWVAHGEGVATRKFDGTPVLLREGKGYKRFTLKPGMRTPDGYEPAQQFADEGTGELPGWIPIDDSAADEPLREAIAEALLVDGTYEAVGPKINGNPEGYVGHRLVKHGGDVLSEAPPRNFAGLRAYLADSAIEGIVWHHPDGRMVKIKGKDFGIRRVKVTA